MLKSITVNVTANANTFTVATGNMTDFNVGDLMMVRDITKGTLVMECATKNVSAKTGTFVTVYIGATATGLYSSIVPVSSIDPTGDTVIKTQLVELITQALAADQRMAANWEQLLTTPTGNVDIISPTGQKITGPSWQSILSAVINKNITTAQNMKGNLSILAEGGALYVGSDAMTTPTNFDCYGYAAFRKGVSFYDGVNVQGGDVSLAPATNKYASFTATQAFSATSGTFTGPSYVAKVKAGNGALTTMLMSLRHEMGTADYGYISYNNTRGQWKEVRLQSNGDMNNLTGNWVTGSDYRIKENKVEVEDPIALIRDLKLYTYERDGVPGIGGIAQEIEQTLPLLVREGGSLTLKNGNVVDRVKSVDYGTMGYIAVAALNKALDKIEELEKRLAVLEAK